jgi:transcription antitermination factor NusG
MKTIEEKRTLSKWFAHSANWFVLFVRTHEERNAVERLQGKLDTEKYVVFVPTKDYAFKKEGEVASRRVPWLDGYVFIAATVSARECLEVVKPIVYGDPGIYKLLSNDGTSESVMLSKADKAVMTAILDENFNIPAIEAVQVGDRVNITERGLDGMSGSVKKVNKHKRTAIIEIHILGRILDCEVMLEYVAKPPV